MGIVVTDHKWQELWEQGLDAGYQGDDIRLGLWRIEFHAIYSCDLPRFKAFESPLVVLSFLLCVPMSLYCQKFILEFQVILFRLDALREELADGCFNIC